VDQVAEAATRGLEASAALVDSTAVPGAKIARSSGNADVVASIVVDGR
jgi:hypothetical protein